MVYVGLAAVVEESVPTAPESLAQELSLEPVV